MSELHVTGLDELQKLLDTLPAKIEANVMRGALGAGAKIIKAQAQANCPIGAPSSYNEKLYGGYEGALRDSIRVSTRIKNGKVIASIKAGGKTKGGADAYYVNMVEFGTAQHWIKPKNRKSLFFAGLAKEVVDHPGAQAHAFLRPALDARATDAVVAAGEYMKNRLATKNGLDTASIDIEVEV